MNPEKTKSSAGTELEATDSGGFNWQQYKDDRWELHEKLARDQAKTDQPAEQSPSLE